MYKTVDEAFKEVQATQDFVLDVAEVEPFKKSKSLDGLFLLSCLINPQLLLCANEYLLCATVSFEAGRLYGRAQLMEEIGMGVKENAST